MKKVITCVGGLVLSAVFTSALFAGAVDNKTNWSAEYIRTLNRNAATDYADIAAYNPAGTVKLDEGFIINGSAQFLAKDYENIVNGTSFESDEPSVIPGIFGVYNRSKWSLFGAFTNVGGGGKVDFSQGNYTTVQIGTLYSIGADRTTNAMLVGNGFESAPLGTYYDGTMSEQRLSGESYYLSYAFGGAFSFNDMVSVSLTARYVDAYRGADGAVTIEPTPFAQSHLGAHPLSASIDYEQDGDGWGGIIGLNIAPNDALNIGLRYETKTEIDLTATVIEDDKGILPNVGIIDGESVSRDLPALFALGVSYNFTEKLRVESNLTYYFNEDADWNDAEENVDNGFDLGITLEYRFNEKILGSIGYLYTELGMDPEFMQPENPELDANTLGAGIAYAFNEKFHTNFSIGNSFYEDDAFVSSATGAKVEYKKNVFFLALGLEYRFM
jgi:long-chain fatty acid transport protein